MDLPFHCGNETLEEQHSPPRYSGCQFPPGTCSVMIGYRANVADTTLVDELGHYVWQICRQGSGEYRDEDGAPVYEDDFAAWVTSVRQDLLQRKF
jgi:hypothetical protein